MTVLSSRNCPSSSGGLGSLTLRFVAQVTAVNLSVIFFVTRGLFHTLPLLQRISPLLPPISNIFSLVPSVLRDDIVPLRPRRDRNIHQTEFLSEEIRPTFLPLLRERRKRLVHVLARFVLRLEEAEEWREEELGDMVDPDSSAGAFVRIGREEVRGVGRVGVLEEFADDERLVERLAIELDRWDEAFWVDGKEMWFLFVRIDLLVLVRDFLFFECDPAPLHERTEPSAVENELLRCLVFGDGLCCVSGGSVVDAFVGCWHRWMVVACERGVVSADGSVVDHRVPLRTK